MGIYDIVGVIVIVLFLLGVIGQLGIALLAEKIPVFESFIKPSKVITYVGGIGFIVCALIAWVVNNPYDNPKYTCLTWLNYHYEETHLSPRVCAGTEPNQKITEEEFEVLVYEFLEGK